jgi:hypothetical protein
MPFTPVDRHKRRNGSRANNADPGNSPRALARLVCTMLCHNPVLNQSNERLQGLKLCCQHYKAYKSTNGQALISFAITEVTSDNLEHISRGGLLLQCLHQLAGKPRDLLFPRGQLTNCEGAQPLT